MGSWGCYWRQRYINKGQCSSKSHVAWDRGWRLISPVFLQCYSSVLWNIPQVIHVWDNPLVRQPTMSVILLSHNPPLPPVPRTSLIASTSPSRPCVNWKQNCRLWRRNTSAPVRSCRYYVVTMPGWTAVITNTRRPSTRWGLASRSWSRRSRTRRSCWTRRPPCVSRSRNTRWGVARCCLLLGRRNYTLLVDVELMHNQNIFYTCWSDFASRLLFV